MRLLALLLCLSCGCIGRTAPSQNTSPVIRPIVAPIDVSPVAPTQYEATVTASVPQSLLSMLFQYLGSENTITLKSSLTLKQPNVSVTLPSGTNLSYSLSEQKGTFTFGNPRPVAEVVEMGIKIHPHVDRVVILPDNTGVLTAEWNGFHKDRKFDLQWTDREKPAGAIESPAAKPKAPTQSAAKFDKQSPSEMVGVQDNRPEMWIFVDESEMCDKASSELESDKLPFRVVRKMAIPQWLTATITTFPSYYWPADSKQVYGARICKVIHGYHDKDAIVDAWKKSRVVRKAAVAQPEIRFGNPWFENGGHTSEAHLREHGIPQWAIDRYRGNRFACDRLHGAMHERGSIF